MSARRLPIEAFARAIKDQDLSLGPLDLLIPDSDVPVPVNVMSFAPGNSTVCYTFHGAVNQDIRPLPVFYGSQFASRFPEKMTLISIADPGLRLSTSALYTWYAGDFGCPTRRGLSDLCSVISSVVKPSKTIFIGGSSGAHPALLHSHAIPGSFCLSVNPLVSIAHGSNMQRYAAICWPDLSIDDAVNHVVDDVCSRYGSGYPNKVIVLQNASDPHIKFQALPLAAALARQRDSLYISEFFPEHLGHSYPPGPLDTWLGAVLGSSTGDLVDIATLAVRHRTKGTAEATKAKLEQDPAELALADRIAAGLLEANA